MMDYLASMYIDNELDLQDKIRFIDRIQSDPPYYRDTRALLRQEEILRLPPDTSLLPDRPPARALAFPWLGKILKPVLYAAAGFAAAGLLLFGLVADPGVPQCFNRFVLYEPTARQVELAGSFTGWQRKPMAPIGDSGYWELRMRVPPGEHRFAYILDGSKEMPDPTLPVREKDDFGGHNSILNMEDRV